jgi:hypothetical protein
MNVAAMPPILIPQLCISINYRDDIATFPKDVVVIVTQKGSEVLELARFAFSLPAPDSPIINDPLLDEGSVMFGEMRMEARISPFHVIENCRINVRAYVGGDEIRLGSLAVRLNPPPEPDTLKTE